MEENNKISITITDPINDSTISNCENVAIKVAFTASIENHEVEVLLHPEGDTGDKIIDFDKHSHDLVIDFEQSIDLCSYAAGTCFHLELVACLDHDCAEKETADVEFCLSE